jgi:Xaa-Pro aminopeptidase
MDSRERVVKELRAQGLDAVVVASPENVYYLSEIRLLVQRLVPDRESFVIMTADGKSTLITVESDADFARRDSKASAVVGYGHGSPPAEVLATTLRDAGLDRSKVGLESVFLPTGDYWTLSTQLPNATFVPGDTVMRRARMSKLPHEIARLRRAEHLTELAVTAAFAMTREGDTEIDITKRISMNLTAHGAEAVDFVLLTAAINSTIYHLPPSDYRVKRGDVIHLDCGGSFDNYRSDLSRNVGVGSLTTKQIDTYARLWDVERGVIDRIRPGVTVKEMVATYLDLMKKSGLTPPGAHLGHGVGLSSHEYPELLPDIDETIVPGMVMAIEPTTFIQGDARYDIEDTVLVTEKGCEMLSGGLNPRAIWII